MNKFQLYRLLHKNTQLSLKRSPVFEQNKWAKALIYLGSAFFGLYLILYGIIIAMFADGWAGCMISFMPFILLIDYLLRFIFQTTPGMMVKPYILQPISRYTAIECFLISSHLSGYNFLWLMMFVPYAYIILIAGAGFWPVTLELIACVLLMILNSQIYLFFRTLVNRNVLWFIPGIILYLLPLSPAIIDFNGKTLSKLIDTFAAIGRGWYLIPAILLVMVLLFFINRHLQFKFVYEEISKKSEKALKHISQFSFLNRFGLIGEYLKIEAKSNMRNKTMRARCIMSLSLIIVLSLLIAYTSIYDSELMLNFWCLYCFAIYGITALIKIMGQEATTSTC